MQHISSQRILRLVAPVIVLAVAACAFTPDDPDARAAHSDSRNNPNRPSLDLALENAEDFVTVFPGRYLPSEITHVQAYFADNAAINARGPVDVERLINGTLPDDTPGIGPVVHVSRDWVTYTNGKYDWENPLKTDPDYARAAGFSDIQASPFFAAHDDTYMAPYPPPARDTLLVSDLNHSVTTFEPIYPGDTLFLVTDHRQVVDLTPTEGSKYRSVAIQTQGSIYNQHGRKVNEVTFRVTESMKTFIDEKKPVGPPDFSIFWESPNWLSRPERVYSDDDWRKIREIWAGERRQGAAPLYWEDVEVGDKPAWTLDGPIESSVGPVSPWGLGKGGSRTLKAEILDEKVFATLIRNATDGIYRSADRNVMVPTPPPRPAAMAAPVRPGPPPPDGAVDTRDIHKDRIARSPLINYMGREFATRHVSNWMGDQGWLRTMSWSIMEPRSHWALGKGVPVNPAAERFLSRTQSVADRHLTTHGLTKDVAIVKSEVVSKYVLDDEPLVELVWWIETLDGDIWVEGLAVVRLPMKASAS